MRITMVKHSCVRTIAALGFLGCATLFGCGSGLGPVRATWNGGIDRPNLPDITVERAKACVAEYGTQLEPRGHVFLSKVQVNEDGDKEDVTIDDLPNTAPDFGACMRNVLRDMPIAEEPFRQGVETLKYRREQASAAQRSLMGSPVVVVAGVTIVVGELMLEAGAYTVLLSVSVVMVEKATKDVVEAAKKGRWFQKCVAHYAACMATPMGDWLGNHWDATRCNTCFNVCRDTESWPVAIGNGSCEYWNRRWGL